MNEEKGVIRSIDDEYVLAELSLDEYKFIMNLRAEFNEIKEGVTFSVKPRYLKARIETPDKIIELNYPKSNYEYIETTPKNRNKEKKSFGTIQTKNNRLEFASYPKFINKGWYVFLNGQRIWCHRDEWRNLFRISLRIGHFMGFLGRKKKKKGRFS